MSGLYRLGIGAYHLLIRLYAWLGNRKAKAWLRGRREPIDWSALAAVRQDRPLVWMHCASLGEWEQGRPVLESLLNTMRVKPVAVLTFYSPSGYDYAKDYDGADLVTYLPPDGPASAQAFQSRLRPDLALFVKYEFWHYHLRELDRTNVPTVLVAGAFRAGQPFFLGWGSWWRKMLHRFDMLLVQSVEDRDLLQKIYWPSEKLVVTGDPRVERTLAIADESWEDPILAAFAAGDKPILIAGSVWAADVQRLQAAWPELRKHYRLLLAPHQLTKQNLFDWSNAFSAQRYTLINSPTDLNSEVLMLDTMGMLSRAYRYAKVAYVGGGFGAGIHNTLEPMAYGLPVIFGPRIHKFREAVTMVDTGGGFIIETADQLRNQLLELLNEEGYLGAKVQVDSYMQTNQGATERSVEAILGVWKG